MDLRLYMHTLYGKGLMKKCRLSPDAYIQMALQLAYFRVFPQSYDILKICMLVNEVLMVILRGISIISDKVLGINQAFLIFLWNYISCRFTLLYTDILCLFLPPLLPQGCWEIQLDIRSQYDQTV